MTVRPVDLGHVKGFSLIELAVVLLVVSVLAAGAIGSTQALLENHRYRVTQQRLDTVSLALVGHAIAHAGRFPCPDVTGDGDGDTRSLDDERCRSPEGFVPWRTLGVPARDAWGSVLRYRPDRTMVRLGGLRNPPNTLENIMVFEGDAPLVLGKPHGPVAVLLSCGANQSLDRRNATGVLDGRCNSFAGAKTDYSYGPPGHGFDDVVLWVSKNVLLARLVDARVWPN